jgi:hypothetical protein
MHARDPPNGPHANKLPLDHFPRSGGTSFPACVNSVSSQQREQSFNSALTMVMLQLIFTPDEHIPHVKHARSRRPESRDREVQHQRPFPVLFERRLCCSPLPSQTVPPNDASA